METKEDFKKDLERLREKEETHVLEGVELGKLLAYEAVENLILFGVGSSLPKVCTGCGSLSTEVIDKKYLACCPDNNYVPLEEYLENSRYTRYTKFKR